MTWTLAAIEKIIRSSWGADTFPPDIHNPVWDPANPARGHCIVTALVVHDLLGVTWSAVKCTSAASESILTGGICCRAGSRWT
jgi:hypothetical protein